MHIRPAPSHGKAQEIEPVCIEGLLTYQVWHQAAYLWVRNTSRPPMPPPYMPEPDADRPSSMGACMRHGSMRMRRRMYSVAHSTSPRAAMNTPQTRGSTHLEAGSKHQLARSRTTYLQGMSLSRYKNPKPTYDPARLQLHGQGWSHAHCCMGVSRTVSKLAIGGGLVGHVVQVVGRLSAKTYDIR